MLRLLKIVAQKIMKINRKQIPELVKGIFNNFLAITGLTQVMPNREQERMERESEKLMDRAEKLSRQNNKRLMGRR